MGRTANPMQGPLLALLSLPILAVAAIAQSHDQGGEETRRERIDGVWVSPEHIADAAKGIFHHEGELVTRDELAAFQAGMVRHPRTGQLIEGEELQQAREGRFPLGDGRWVSLPEADRYHSTMDHPWVYRGQRATLVGTLSLEGMEEAMGWVDAGYELAQDLLQVHPSPLQRPVVVLVEDADQYDRFARSWAGPDAPSWVFVSRTTIELPGVPGQPRAAFVEYGDEGWRPYRTRHAGALAYVEALCRDLEAEVPEWFKRAMGSYAGRHALLSLSRHFGGRAVGTGYDVPQDMKGWFRSFALDGAPETIDSSLYTAGLLVRFAIDENWAGEELRGAWTEVVGLFRESSGRRIPEAIDVLEQRYGENRDLLARYLGALIR